MMTIRISAACWRGCTLTADAASDSVFERGEVSGTLNWLGGGFAE
jgi:hypothetical protein